MRIIHITIIYTYLLYYSNYSNYSRRWDTLQHIITKRMNKILLGTENIGLSGKFVPMLKENWNAENLNFSTHLLNYIG